MENQTPETNLGQSPENSQPEVERTNSSLSATLSTLLALSIIGNGALGYLLWQNQQDLEEQILAQEESKEAITDHAEDQDIRQSSGPKFDEDHIVDSFDFTSSTGDSMRLIAYNPSSNQDTGAPTTNVYMTGSDLNKEGSIRIKDLDGHIGFSEYKFHLSPGSGIRYIVVETQFADSFATFIVNESGEVITSNIVENAYAAVEVQGQFGIRFLQWESGDKFIIGLGDAMASEWDILFDATDGSVISSEKTQ